MPHKSISDRNALVERVIDLVPRLAWQLGLRPTSRSWDDAVQAGCLALMAAAERYDETRGVPFRAYARLRVVGAIKDALSFEQVVSESRRAINRRAAVHARTDRDVFEDVAPAHRAALGIDSFGWDGDSYRVLPAELVDTEAEDRAVEAADRGRLKDAVEGLPALLRDVARAVLYRGQTIIAYARVAGIPRTTAQCRLEAAQTQLMATFGAQPAEESAE